MRVMKLAALGAAATLVLAACGDAPEDEPGGTTPETAEEVPDETSEEPMDPTETSDDMGGTASEEPTSDTGGETDAPGDAADFKACMVSDQGGFDDQSFNQSGRQGMEAAQEALGVETVLVESQSDADYGPNIANLVQQDCDLTFGVGFLLEDAIQTAAEGNPDINFALIDSALSDADFAPIELENAKPILFNTSEAAFLAGYLSAGTTQTGTVATFGGINIPSVAIFMDGFSDGIDTYNADNGTDVKLLGWDKEAQDGAFSGDFENQANGQTLAEQFIAQGADIIMPVAGPVGLGAAAAAEGTEGTMIVWVDSDGTQTTDYGDIILTSVLKQIGPAVETTITDTVNGGFSNEPYVGTLANEGVGIADPQMEVPAELLTALEDYEQQIIDGTLVIESPNSPTG